MSALSIKWGNKDDPPLQVSKWSKIPVLLNGTEMNELMTALGKFFIVCTGNVIPIEEGIINNKNFLENYTRYPEALSQGKKPDENLFRQIVPCIWTSSLDPLYAILVAEEKKVIRVEAPVIQLQHHRFDYSSVDGKFRSMVLGQHTIFWGIQFSYPQLYEKPNTHEIIQLNDKDAYPNTALFRSLQRWIRHHTIATPFLIGKETINVPIRLGKECLAWIHHHPQLIERRLKLVYEKSIK